MRETVLNRKQEPGPELCLCSQSWWLTQMEPPLALLSPLPFSLLFSEGPENTAL